MSPIKIFFSYSETKSPNPAQIRRLMATVRASVEKRGWEVVDAMEPGIIGIRDDVENSLWDADACIVEATTSSPNVMFEAGFARAMKYPTLFLVNRSTYEQPGMQEYFKFLKIGRDNPLPADVGDIEYLEYSLDLESAGNRSQFQQEVEKRLDAIYRSLHPEERLLRRHIKEFYRRSIQFAEKHPSDHPLLGFVAGRLGLLAEGYDVHGEQVFETDARFYRACLAVFEAEDRERKQAVRAVADLADGTSTESFWYEAPDPVDISAAERIFLADWKSLLDLNEMDRIHRVLRQHAGHYPVRLGSKQPVSPDQRLFGDATAGQHLLLMAPDLVAGYVNRGSRTNLRVERSTGQFRRAERLYGQLRTRSVEVRPDGTAEELRRAWIELERIGLWDPAWQEHENRPDHYFRNYDLHIRCWVPDYDAFIHHCANVVQRAISQRVRESDTRIAVLEIGYGTGALTAHLLAWISNLNEPLRVLKSPLIVTQYVGIDAAERMREVVQKQFAESRVPTLFDVARAPDWTEPVLNNAPYDVICGSLVLHDLVNTQADDAALEGLLRAVGDILSPRGSVVFADTFILNPANRAQQIDGWRRWMRRVGLNDGEIDLFFDRNPEMIDTVTEAQMAAAAEKTGFEAPKFTLTPAAQLWSPFRVMRLRKK